MNAFDSIESEGLWSNWGEFLVGKSILVVDDEDIIRRIVADELEEEA